MPIQDYGQTSQDFSIEPASSEEVCAVTVPSGAKVLGGGYTVSIADGNVLVRSSRPTATGWEVRIWNLRNSQYYPDPITLTVFVTYGT